MDNLPNKNILISTIFKTKLNNIGDDFLKNYSNDKKLPNNNLEEIKNFPEL